MNILSRLSSFTKPFKKHPWFFSGVFVFLVVTFTLVGFEYAHAILEDIKQGFLWAVVNIFLAIARFFIGMTIFALRFFIEIASYNGYIDTPTVVIGWLLVRDVANMFFVVILLVIAFGTILGIEQYEWKKTMGHFILAAIFINFSKTICGLIIDVAHVFSLTFLNAVSAAAGGNLITMFNFDSLLSFARGPGKEGVGLDLIIAGMAAVIFSFLALWTIGAYMIIMLARVLVLWILIILSPLAFILQAVPGKPQSYASQWWEKFTNQVLVAPVMVFFFWLAFATLGAGKVASDQLGLQLSSASAEANSVLQQEGEAPNPSILEGTTWENMANFFIAAGMLWVGLMVVGQMGVVAGGLTQSVMSAAKKVAMIATGYAAGRWLVGKMGDGAIGLSKGVAYRLPLIGGRSWKRRGYAVAQAWEEKFQKRRDDKAQKWDEKYRDIQELKMKAKMGDEESKRKLEQVSFKDKITARTGRFFASALQTNDRSEKELEDYKESLERTKKWHKDSVSTSKLPGGILKQRVTGEMKIQEKISERKGSQKVSAIMELLFRTNPDLADKVNKATMKDELASAELEKTEGEGKRRYAASDDGQRIFQAIAKAMNIKEKLAIEKKLFEAIDRAEAYKSSGDSFRAEQVLRSTYQAIEEENAAKFKSMGRSERGDATKKIISKLQEQGISEQDKEQMSRDMFSILNYAASQGAEEYKSVFHTALKKLYGDDDVDLSAENQGRLVLELLAGKRIVGASDQEMRDNFERTQQEVKSRFGRDGILWDPMMSTFLNKSLFTSFTSGGAAEMASVTDFEDQNGVKRYQLYNPFNRTPEELGRVRRGAYNSEMVSNYVNVGSINDLDSFLKTKISQGNVLISDFTEEGEEAMKSLLTSFGDTRAVSTGFKNNFSGRFGRERFESHEARIRFMKFLKEKVYDDYKARGKEDVAVQLMKTQFAEFISDMNEDYINNQINLADDAVEELQRLEDLLHQNGRR